MNQYCVWKPMVKAPSGEMVESQLFDDLINFCDGKRADAVQLYGLLKSDEFKNRNQKIIKFDNAGEPTLSSVLSVNTAAKQLDQELVTSHLTDKIGGFNKDKTPKVVADTTDNYLQFVTDCAEFNNNSPYK